MNWLADHEPLAVPDADSLRTAGVGWLHFTSPSRFIYKAGHGRVDLYVSEHGFTGTVEDLEDAVAAGWGPDGFVAAVDTKGNPVLRFEHPDILAHSKDGVPVDTSGVEQALNAAANAVRWLADQGGSLLMPEGELAAPDPDHRERGFIDRWDSLPAADRPPEIFTQWTSKSTCVATWPTETIRPGGTPPSKRPIRQPPGWPRLMR